MQQSAQIAAQQEQEINNESNNEINLKGKDNIEAGCFECKACADSLKKNGVRTMPHGNSLDSYVPHNVHLVLNGKLRCDLMPDTPLIELEEMIIA